MLNRQFWRNSHTFNEITITTYYLVETNTYLFDASNIFNAISKLNESIDEENKISFPISKAKIRIFLNKKWEMINVLTKDNILDVTASNQSQEVKCFNEWIINICCNMPEGCILSKSSKEYEFLDLATNKFLDLYAEINCCTFMDLSAETRLYKIRDIFSVYAEMMLYPPIKDHIEFLEKTRPPMESVIASDVVKFIRNILAHFPFFTTWDEIYFSKQLINWHSEGQSIDRFLNKYQGHGDVVYRFRERESGKWRYPTIRFPKKYNDDKFFLKDMINEKDGILLCVLLMFGVVSSQIINITDK